jgi:hypothetical protein
MNRAEPSTITKLEVVTSFEVYAPCGRSSIVLVLEEPRRIESYKVIVALGGFGSKMANWV